jgi:transposase
METFVMTKAEVARLAALQRLEAGDLNQAEIAGHLRLSVRQVKRLWRAYKADGPTAVISRRRGRPSNRRVAPELLERAIELVRTRYPDFGPTLAGEQLAQREGITLGRETLRKAMIAAGLWSSSRKRRPKVHPPRERRPCSGELVQGDGSPHDWFEGRGPRCSLLLFVDDATSSIGAGLFARSESTQAYFALIRQYLEQHGKPYALYVDKLAVFKTNRPHRNDDLTQFARAMQELDIEIICANSPQAKGRVERANRTLQDRLVKELRILGISSVDDANAFLPDFLGRYNQRFAVAPRNEIDAHRPLTSQDDLDAILCHCEERAVSKDLTFKYNGALFQIDEPGRQRRLRFQRILMRERATGTTVEYHGSTLAFNAVPIAQRPTIGSKDLNAFVDQHSRPKRILDPKKQRMPAANHPWRTRATPPQAAS